MKRKRIFVPIIILASLVLVSVTAVAVWYFTPKTFLEKVSRDDISSIVVFNGNSGNRFVIESDEEISAIVDNIRSISMRRDNVSSGYSGSAYHLCFKDAEDETTDFFIVNSDTTIRDDPFFYRSRGGDLCFNYLFELEEKYTGMNEANEAAFVKKDSQETDFAVTIGRIAPVSKITDYPDVAVINSPEELAEYYEGRGEIKTNVSFATEYDSEYFRENVLVLIAIEEQSGSILYKDVDYVGITDEGKLALFLIKHTPGGDLTNDMAYWLICVEANATVTDGSDVLIYCNSMKIYG